MAPRCEDYTVGWVCALPIELAAALEMLDEDHDELDPGPNDSNIYGLGRIGDHNVVIACLPDGQIGVGPAATVAAQMKSTFPSIRFGLMVGIGGGVPGEEDVRLGDIVVSKPFKEHGGVVQYDLGKETPTGFQRTGCLAPPPPILLSAVSRLQANYLREKSDFAKHHSRLDKLERFSRKNAGPDVLFQANYEHVGGATCNGCSNKGAVKRELRKQQETMVHYGTIASGNLVMKTAAERDRISAELNGVLCFEMEAAGLMNYFPCIVIRGICDYADSHKNKSWQPYAAGAAAAYAKELLSVIPVEELKRSRTVDEIIIDKIALDDILNQLPSATEAPFNSSRKQYESTCLTNTRVDLLEEIYHWGEAKSDDRTIYWLNGLAGTGKSTIARTVARKYHDEGRLGASFFFAKGGGDVSNGSKFFTSIALQLGQRSPSLKRYICDTLAKMANVANQSFRDQWQHLVLNPLSRSSKEDPNPSFYVLVVDALDECGDENHIHIILQLLAEARSLPNRQLRIFMTSRPETPIRHGFGQISLSQYQDFVLHTILPAVVDGDIAKFFEYNLGIIAKKQYLSPDWPGKETIDRLVQNAAGLFIWASTACRFISEGGRFAVRRLSMVLEGNAGSIIAAERHLNEIYITVLKQYVSSSDYMDEEVQELCASLRHILGSIVLLFAPLSAHSLSRLLQVRREEIYLTLDNLRAIVDVPEDRALPLRLHHPSFRDFFTSKERCTDPRFLVDVTVSQWELAKSCIDLLSGFLKQDICKRNAPGADIRDLNDDQIGAYLPVEIQYACLYWVGHLGKSEAQLYDNCQFHRFLQDHFLHWLEALCWMREISAGIRAIAALESTVLASNCPSLQAFVYDMKRFALYSRPAMQNTPLQLYYSALAFAPKTSLVRKQFDHIYSRLGKLVIGQNNWDALLSTFETQSGRFLDIAFSPDNRMLALCGTHGIEMWDTDSGEIHRTLSSPSSTVFSITFSPDGMLLASVSDTELKLWDARSGADLLMSKPRRSFVHQEYVVFSPDSKLIASASRDEKITLWAIRLEERRIVAHQTFVDDFAVSSVAFSPDGKTLASTSISHCEVKLWKVSSRQGSGKLIQSLKGHSGAVKTLAYSQHGKLLASASYDGTIILWDVSSVTIPVTIKHSITATFHISELEFTSNDKVLRSLSKFGQIEQWDIGKDPELVVPLETLESAGSHNLPVIIALSPNNRLLASARDDLVQLWDNDLLAALERSSQAPQQESEPSNNHTERVQSIKFAPNGKLVASTSSDKSLKLWQLPSGNLLYTLKDAIGWFTMKAFSPDSEVLALSDFDWTSVTLLRTNSEGFFKELEHGSSIRGIAFSPNSELLATFGAKSNIIKLWAINSGSILRKFEAPSDEIQSSTPDSRSIRMAFSPDGKLLACSPYSTGRIDLFSVDSGDLLLIFRTSSFQYQSFNEQSIKAEPHEIRSMEAQWIENDSDWDDPDWEDSDWDDSHRVDSDNDYFRDYAFSPDSKLLGAVWRSCIILWDVVSGTLLYELSHGEKVDAKLWDTVSGLNLSTVELQEEFDEHSKLLVSDDKEYVHNKERILLTRTHSHDRAVCRGNVQLPLRVDGQWILKGGQKLFWLPPDYRSNAFDIHGNTVVLGSESGRVAFLNFSTRLFGRKHSRLAIRV
ncbi:WD40 repeat-like protein [Lepidopterella palustris CBS 459.81]|uniref:WD40 repeat-like protein n=1 Tax=Lepidopterella palustris CBS 459.81 TaxID=1314670 RepID=A0A8E2DX47_9PEZI|nr:WD40 repeat-like protein [Lepidopterella palustris CBS 459.81]